ncbi:hypothetical protein FN846DRAFT_434570 [Sphaerosporella brunnea]|uniref:C2H2-type domain-containing protein n=1 Tax=Sphaerosporella brunnea TaxID=1250544 RepID=A0A5J5EFZ8_9PEZI|nr:hypothetical protein FN846DRAFT_434570 [Sphaerosporella brunnea]
MSKAGEANPKWPPRTEKLVCLPQMHASKSPSSSAKSSLLQRIDTPKPVTPSKHQCVQPCHTCKHQGLSCGSPKPELLEKGDAGSQEVQKHSKPPVSLVGVGQSFRRRKCDATEEYPQTVVFEHHNLDSIPAYERPVKKVSDGAACYPSQPPQNQSLCPAVGNYQDEDEDDEGETETCSGSPSSHFSFDIVSFSDVPGFREHAGGADSGKRKAAIQGNRAIGGGGNGDGGAQKRAKNDLSMSRSGPGSNGDEDDGDDGDYDDDGPGERLLFACPYYKRDPGDHFKCERQTFASVSRVKGHVLRAHLKPLQCARCGTFRAGDEGQIRKHLRTTNCQQPARFIPVDERIIQKGKDLKKGSRKAVTWKQVYVVLFDCAESEVPSEYPEPAVRATPQRPAAVPTAVQSPVNNGPVQDTVPVSSKNTLEHLVQAKLAAMIEEPMRRFVSDLANTIAAQLPLEDWNAAMEREPG